MMEKQIPTSDHAELTHVPTFNCSCHQSQASADATPQEGLDEQEPSKTKGKWYRFFSPILTFLQVLAIALFPKCPICWAAYMGMAGAIGLGNLPYQPWLYPVLIASLLLYFAALLFRAKSRNGYGPFLVSLVGALFLGLFQYFELLALMYLSVAFFLLGSAWNVLPRKWILSKFANRFSFRFGAAPE